MHQYGIDITKLDQLICKITPKKMSWGQKFKIAREKDYLLERIDLHKNKSASFSAKKDWETTFFVEEGLAQVNNHSLDRHKTITIAPLQKVVVFASENSCLYLFSGPSAGKKLKNGVQSTFDFREKYWGTIETITNNLYTGKRLFFRKNQHSSLHFHVKKTETYFIHSGQLLVRLRAGRGEDRFFELSSHNTLCIAPGLMHQDGGLKDTVIIEISVHDEDSDSFIVENGQKGKMPKLIQ
jgi:mannose-6-phosphate isomerase-like protein (cupin superfamily)